MTVPQRVLDTMNSGLIYACDDEEMIKAQQEQMELLYDFNATRPSQMTQRIEIARQLLGEFGEDAYIEPPLHANGDATRILVHMLTPISTSRWLMMVKCISANIP